VYGGLRFFERAEIKDALAYLRLTQTRSDDVSFERVVNLPTRGIGTSTLDRVREAAREKQLPMWDATIAALSSLPTRAATALRGFIELIDGLQRDIAQFELHEQVRRAIEASGLREHHARERDNRGEARVENLDELVNAAEGFMPEPGDDLPLLASFLAHATLESGETQAAEGRDCVQLMTLHSAKGLEFPTVFLVGLEEGLFPSERSAGDPEKLPEERRLCYVGITRAMQRLYISHAETRRIYGRTEYRAPSRFLAEIPSECIDEVRPRLSVSRPLYDPGHAARPLRGKRSGALTAPPRPRRGLAGEEFPIRLGARVRHPKFGEGIVLGFEGNDEHRQVQVNFEGVGPKWLMYAYAKLEVSG
jgi:DNA helicase-2/ATP-dependent DNA helicase PcrA